jgi:IrrE N-terminal-like domain
MKPYRSKETGELRLWFSPGEIDEWMEVELRKAGLYPTPEDPRVDIERFVDGYLDVDLDQYAPLSETVLGQTRFEAGKRARVLINRSLTAIAVDADDPEPWLRSKWRMTMAHEATHVLLHKGLYPSDTKQQTLFALDDEKGSGPGGDQTYQCLERNLTRGGGNWREVQANMGMAALLMPKALFLAVLQSERERLSIGSGPILKGSGEANQLARSLARRFDVSIQSVEIRLEEFKAFAVPGQVQLL